MNFRTAIAASALALVASTASAESVKASNPQSIMDYFFSAGEPARLGRDSVDDPMITVRRGSSEYTVFFYGCVEGANCDSIQFYSGYKAGGSVSVKLMNQWNTDHRYSRAYVNEEGAVKLEYDVFLGTKGMGSDDFGRVVSIWEREFDMFEETIGW